MGFGRSIALVLLGAILASPPSLRLDFGSAAYSYILTAVQHATSLAGKPVPGVFDPAVQPGSLQLMRKDGNEKSAQLNKLLGSPNPAVNTTEVVVRGTKCLLHKPLSSKGLLPVLVYFHGGGYVAFSPVMIMPVLEDVVLQTGIAVLSVDYELAPESKFPGPVLECVKVVEWISSGGGAAMGLDGSRIALAGDSAGGGLTAAVTLYFKENLPTLLPSIKGLGFLYPWVDQTLSSSSLYLFSEGYFLTLKVLVWYRQQYLSKPEDSVNVLASPLLATLEQLTNFPPSLVITAEFDPLRDEGEAFAAKLTSAGVDVTLTRYNATIHAFPVFPWVPNRIPAIAQLSDFLAKALHAVPQASQSVRNQATEL